MDCVGSLVVRRILLLFGSFPNKKDLFVMVESSSEEKKVLG